MTTAVGNKTDILERGTHAFREGGGSGSRREVTIIRAGWGSSGYYSEDVLKRDIPRIFPVGTRMYMNHPTPQEDAERPERRVEDWVGTLVETPRMAGIDSVAVAEVFPHWQPVIDSIGENLGLSIRAFGMSEWGSAGGKDGPIIESLTEGLSIDYVTQAGAGGKVGRLIESARGGVPIEEEALWICETVNLEESDEVREAERLYDEFLEREISKDKRIALAKKGQAIPVKDKSGNIINGRFPMENCEDVKAAAMSVGRTNQPDIKSFIKKVASKLSCPVPFKAKESKSKLGEARNAGNYLEALIHRRFTETADNLFGEGHLTREERIALSSAIGDGLQAFSASLEKEAPQLFSRDPYEELEAPEEAYIQQSKCGSGRDNIKEADMADDNALSELRKEFDSFKESMEKRVQDAETKAQESETKAKEAEKRADRAEEKNLRVEAGKVASKVVEEGASSLSSKAKERVITESISGDLPTRDGNLDTAVLEERTRANLRTEVEYLGEAAGIGKVSGAGGSGDLFKESGNGSGNGTGDNKALVESFKKLGMGEDEAKAAAEGR